MTGDACPNLGVLRSVDGSDPFTINRNVAGARIYHQNFRRRSRCSFFSSATTQATNSDRGQTTHPPNPHLVSIHKFTGCARRNSNRVPAGKMLSPKLNPPRDWRVV